MSGILFPAILATIAVLLAASTYRGIRRGGARIYTLEREAMLRHASFSLFGSVLFFLAALGILILDYQRLTAPPEEPAAAVEADTTPLPTPGVQQFPPTPTSTATPDPNEPPPTPTPLVCRAAIENTGGSGLRLRQTPGGTEVRVLPDGTLVTLLEDAPVQQGGTTWRRVRVIGGEEGWVSQEFLTIAPPCE